ncbi:MAG: cellulase family glycosylhydrolase [Chitinophagaceae bacterium]
MMKVFRELFLVLIFFAAGIACSKSGSGNNPEPDPDPDPPPAPVHRPHFYVDGSALRDSTGRAFVMRGNNFPVFWFPNEYKPSLAAAASLGCNSARLVWQVDMQAWTPGLSVLDEAIAECVRLRMVPVVELHDFTGGNSANDISQAVNYYLRSDVKAILQKYSAFLILNIANEWGGSSVTALDWRNAYLPAILNLRNGGYKMPIMIDAPGYGQTESAIVQYGANLLNADPDKNIIFSTHGYSNWNNPSTYAGRIQAILDKNLCLVFGEFGWNVPDDQQPADFVCKVDASLLMQICQSKKLGYLGWSWKGNNAANACFEMCGSWSDTSQLTVWGRQWAYDLNGVKNTGIKSPAFP